MGSALHFVLLFSGLWTLALCASRQFYVVNKSLNWIEAQKHCKANYTDLATIENDEEMEMVNKYVTAQKNSLGNKENVWIGLKQNQTAWHWSDGALINYTNWNDSQPDNENSNDNCVELYSKLSYKWNDANCSHRHAFLCYKSQIPLIVIPQNKTWHEALIYCRENHEDLVSISSQETQSWVAYVAQYNPLNATDMWIGLRHTSALGFWYWVSGHTAWYQNWADGQGTVVEDCSGGERTGAMRSNGQQWVSLHETQKLPFICILS